MTDDTPRQLPLDALDRVLAGEATPDERVRLEHELRTLAQDEGRTGDALWHAVRQPDTPSSERKFRGAERLRQAIADESQLARAPRARRWLRFTLPAGLVGAAAAGIFWLAPAWRPHVAPSTANIAFRTISAPAGQRASVTLDDGTRVLLNAGTTLRIPTDLRLSRSVDVAGEASFEVRHHADIPFIVRTGTAQVTVLGTAFTVRRYPEDARVRVVVMQGRVSVAPTRTPSIGATVLGARTLADISDSGQVIVTPDVAVDDYTEWMRGTMAFHAAPLREVIPALERHYGITIRLADSTLASRQLTATVTNDPPAVLLDFMARTLGARYVRDGNVVTFYPMRTVKPEVRRGRTLHSEVSYGK